MNVLTMLRASVDKQIEEDGEDGEEGRIIAELNVTVHLT
jgi:hypothetical protein